MGLFDKIKGFINDPEEDEDEEYDTVDDSMDFVSKPEEKAAEPSTYGSADAAKKATRSSTYTLLPSFKWCWSSPNASRMPAPSPIISMPSGRSC